MDLESKKQVKKSASAYFRLENRSYAFNLHKTTQANLDAGARLKRIGITRFLINLCVYITV